MSFTFGTYSICHLCLLTCMSLLDLFFIRQTASILPCWNPSLLLYTQCAWCYVMSVFAFQTGSSIRFFCIFQWCHPSPKLATLEDLGGPYTKLPYPRPGTLLLSYKQWLLPLGCPAGSGSVG